MRRPTQTEADSAAHRYVVGCDSRLHQNVFSGSTFHLALEGVRDGFLTGMANLYPQGARGWSTYARAAMWRLNGRRGFKFTDAYLDSVWKRGLPRLRRSIVISNCQTFGPYFLRQHSAFGVTPYLYIDGTLTEYFRSYHAFDTSRIDEIVIRRAIEVERHGYAEARKIIVMSRRTAAHIVQAYGVAPEKVEIVPPGANIPETPLEILESQQPWRPRPDTKVLSIGFIGLYPERKGLPLIADAVTSLRRVGYDVRLNVIGVCPPEIAQRAGVIYHGLIDKTAELDRFVAVVRSVDIGCLLSRAELTGIALLEFLRLGVPVLATDVGGIPDIIAAGAGQLLPPEISASALAGHIARLMDEPGAIAALREQAWLRRHNASWRRVVQALRPIVVGETNP